MAKEVKKVAFLTAGGLAPCLSSSIGFLIDEYNRKSPKTEMIGYINGYMGLLKGDSIPVTPEVRKNALVLTRHGASPPAVRNATFFTSLAILFFLSLSSFKLPAANR